MNDDPQPPVGIGPFAGEFHEITSVGSWMYAKPCETCKPLVVPPGEHKGMVDADGVLHRPDCELLKHE